MTKRDFVELRVSPGLLLGSALFPLAVVFLAAAGAGLEDAAALVLRVDAAAARVLRDGFVGSGAGTLD